MEATYRVKAYIEYEIEAPSEEEAIQRLSECVANDLEGGIDIREIAEVAAQKIKDTGIDD
jgi:hypothetical protein